MVSVDTKRIRRHKLKYGSKFSAASEIGRDFASKDAARAEHSSKNHIALLKQTRENGEMVRRKNLDIGDEVRVGRDVGKILFIHPKTFTIIVKLRLREIQAVPAAVELIRKKPRS